MMSIDYNCTNYSIDNIYRYMEAINPFIISDIKTCLGKTIGDYCDKIWKNDIKVTGKYANNAREHINTTLYEYISENYNKKIANEAIVELGKMPVFQTGPHFQLAIEKNNFYSALFSIIGIKRNGGCFYFQSTCTTPTLESRKFYGPMWLNVYDSNFNIFDFSQLYRRKHCVYNAQIEYPYVFKSYLGKEHVQEVEDYIGRLRELLEDVKDVRLVDSFKKANKKIWSKYLSDDIIPIYILEDFYTKLLIEMLKDAESFIYVFFSEWKKQEIVLRTIQASKQLPWTEMIPASSDFFWYVTDRKIGKIRVTKEVLYNEENNIIGENSVENIIELLKNNQIIPNIFTIIMMESYLGQIRLAGGLHQFAYFETFKRAFLNCLNQNDTEENRLAKLIQAQNLNHWGSHVLEPNCEILEILKYDGTTYKHLIEKYSQYSFDDAIDDMSQFRTYHRWGRLLCF